MLNTPIVPVRLPEFVSPTSAKASRVNDLRGATCLAPERLDDDTKTGNPSACAAG